MSSFVVHDSIVTGFYSVSKIEGGKERLLVFRRDLTSSERVSRVTGLNLL